MRRITAVLAALTAALVVPMIPVSAEGASASTYHGTWTSVSAACLPPPLGPEAVVHGVWNATLTQDGRAVFHLTTFFGEKNDGPAIKDVSFGSNAFNYTRTSTGFEATYGPVTVLLDGSALTYTIAGYCGDTDAILYGLSK